MKYSDADRQIIQEEFLKHFRETFNIGAAARLAGIDRDTLRRWREADQEFGKRVEDIAEDVMDDVEAGLLKDAMDPKNPASVRVLAKQTLLNARRASLYNRGTRRDGDGSETPQPIINIYLGAKKLSQLPEPGPRMIDAPAQEIISNEKE